MTIINDPCQLNKYGFQNEELIKSAYNDGGCHLIIPHCYNRHFCVLFVDILKQNVYIYWSFWVNANCFKVYKLPKNYRIRRRSFSCGIFVLQLAICYMGSRSMKNLQPAYLFQKYIFEILISYGDSLDNMFELLQIYWDWCPSCMHQMWSIYLQSMLY